MLPASLSSKMEEDCPKTLVSPYQITCCHMKYYDFNVWTFMYAMYGDCVSLSLAIESYF